MTALNANELAYLKTAALADTEREHGHGHGEVTAWWTGEAAANGATPDAATTQAGADILRRLHELGLLENHEPGALMRGYRINDNGRAALDTLA